ncbi:hypothetical protein QCA50_001437 [Cerrena zonata]|uniref:ABC transmembrane type-1 domain-containing protein n=1 Tax=Cerrena zonata TaxID=2478898 RepID=A0AAW0GVU7_9APHY
MILRGGQVVLTAPTSTLVLFEGSERDASWQNTLLYPSYVAGASTLLLFGHSIAIACYSREQNSEAVGGIATRIRKHISGNGGLIIFTFRLSRLVACLALAALSLASLGEIKSGLRPDIANPAFVQGTLCATFVYASFLAVLTVTTRMPWNSIVAKHLVVVLLAAWGVYFYRDLWPLATFTLKPEDASEGSLLWVKVALLTFAAAIVPITMPRQYIPFDPANPSEEPHPEQTTSWLNLILFNYLTPLVIKGYKQPHLTIDDMSPMNDRDKIENMVQLHYPSLDPIRNKKKSHIFFGLILKAFPREHLGMVFSLFLRVLGSFAAPIGIRNLLWYLESGGKDATVRPWFWVTWLFFGPVFQSIAFNLALWFWLAILVKAQSLTTQLIFDHALRMRVHVESKEHTEADTRATVDPQVSEQEQSEVGSETGESSSSTAVPEQDHSPTTSGSATPKNKKESATSDTKPDTNNIAGRLNNLISGDMSSLQGGQAFVFITFYVPCQLTFSLIYLYTLLGWSIFPGIAAMILLSPLPGLIVKRLASLQAEKMKKSDSRVQSVTEAMNVIRMIKLFGWEDKMSTLLDEKRTEELIYVRRSRFWELANMHISAFIPYMTMLATYGVYTTLMGRDLSASRVFASMLVFETVQEHFHGIFYLIPNLIRGDRTARDFYGAVLNSHSTAKVSLDRINDFLYKTELLDEFSEDSVDAVLVQPSSDIFIRQAAFTWSKNGSDDIESTSRSHRKFVLRVENEVVFKPGCVNIVIGQTGVGKTSLLMALLGEMHYIPLGSQAAVSLPREKGVAYHAQESWVLNETIRNNILFGAPYDEERYNAVIEQCALKRDLELFDAGDQTEVGEKGLTLSGGQKVCICLSLVMLFGSIYLCRLV